MLRFRWLLVLLLVLLVGVAIAQDDGPETQGLRPDAPTYALRGPYPVGARDDLVIENGDRTLLGFMWYPALNPDGAEEVGTLDSHLVDLVGEELNQWPARALINAAPDLENGPYPLVVFSHGWMGSPLLQNYLLEHLASYGFVVVAVEHPGTDYRAGMTLSPEEQEANRAPAAIYEPLDEMAVIDYALTEWADLVDPERIAATGYSGGGQLALKLAGMQYDFANLERECTENERFGCGAMADEAAIIELAGITTEDRQPWAVIEEPVVDVVVGLDAGWLLPFGAEGLAAVSVPTLLISSDAVPGNVVLPEDNAFLAFDSISSDELVMVQFLNAEHSIFMDCANYTAFAFNVCTDNVWDMSRAYDLVNHFTTAFLLDQFYDDADARAALLPEAVQFNGVAYQTTLDQ